MTGLAAQVGWPEFNPHDPHKDGRRKAPGPPPTHCVMHTWNNVKVNFKRILKMITQSANTLLESRKLSDQFFFQAENLSLWKHGRGNNKVGLNLCFIFVLCINEQCYPEATNTLQTSQRLTKSVSLGQRVKTNPLVSQGKNSIIFLCNQAWEIVRWIFKWN